MRSIRTVFRTLVWLPLAAFLALLPLNARAEKPEELPQPTNYVSDFAHVLAPETVARLDNLCSQLDQGAKSKVAVVTVQSFDGDDAASYATRLEDHWKMGDKKENRFALVLLAVADHKYRIEVGYGLEGILPDGKTGDIGREMVPLLRHSDYDGALAGAVGEIAQTVAADAHLTLQNSGDEQVPEQRRVHRGSALGKIILIVVLLLFFGGFSLIRMLCGWGLFFGGFGGGGWRGGGGGFGGGGDGGGGFGGFGGDGGGFGGGGAGGSW